MFKEIVKFIEGVTGYHAGDIIQAGRMVQSAPVRCILIQETGGEPNFYCPDMVNLTIQIICRAANYWDARADAWIIYQAIHGTSNWELPRLDAVSGEENYLAMTVEALQAPYYLGEDDNRRHLFTCNYVWRMEEGSCGESGSGS